MNPAQNNVEAELTIQFYLSQPIPASGSLSIGLPEQNSQFDSLGRPYNIDMVASESLLFPTSYSIYSGSRTTHSPDATVEYSASSGLQIVNVLLNNDDEISAGSVLYVKLQNVLSPPSLAPLSGILVNTGDEDFNRIELVTDKSITNTLPGDDSTATGSQAYILSPTGVLESDAEYIFEINLAGSIPEEGYFTLTIPDEVGLPARMPGGLSLTCVQNCDDD
jgi:hypothetical protein